MFVSGIDVVIINYDKTPCDCFTKGEYASLKRKPYTKGKKILNIVFKKIVGRPCQYRHNKHRSNQININND